MLSVKALARDERASLAEFLATLTPAEWDYPSLCEGWSVRDVVAHHLSYDELTVPAMLGRFARNLGRFDRANADGLAAMSGVGPEQLLELLDGHLTPSGLPTAFGSRIALLDCMVHQQDIRRPLGRPREIPAERLIPALNFARMAPPIGARGRIKGLRLVADDIDWAAGRGSEVTGTGEAILLAMAGRRDAASALSGPGVATLRERLG
ncbi:MAG: maleylpyruvate isomerase family mycothiol-dependent enzyme [Gordonia sp. (in: high G+C Gram-positive bacteria)]|uniref:maleylpyruvate isomerase family mycothiol-dependent enzyme n=1 Tax=Gordonia sp. (in: high G+C Gram-positive bacteria) TaxID=84139 RepID=UPI0039E2700E